MEAEVAVEVRGAGLADRIDHNRTMGIVCAKVRGLHRNFADHVGVGVDRRVGSIARVCDVLPVRVERDASVATVESIDVAAAQSANAVADGAVYAHDSAGEVRRIRAASRGHGKTRQHLAQFRGIAAAQCQLLQFLRADMHFPGAGIGDIDLVAVGRDFDGYVLGANLQGNVDGLLVRALKQDPRANPPLEALGLDRDAIGTRGKLGEREEARRVRDLIPGDLGGLPHYFHFGADDRGSRRVRNGAGKIRED